MARPKLEAGTVFGEQIAKADLDYKTVAEELNVTRQYVGMLARGECYPRLPLAFEIQSWALRHGLKIPVESWEAVVDIVENGR